MVAAYEVIPDPYINADEYTLCEWLFSSKPQRFGLIEGYANPTGVILVVILLVMFICSQPFVRRGGSFEVSTYTYYSENCQFSCIF